MHRAFSNPLQLLVPALYKRTLVRTIDVIPVPEEITHRLLKFWDATTITVNDDTQTLSQAPHW